MPNVLQIGPYRFFFYSRENNEPAHIHVRRDRFEAKFWLNPAVVLASNRGFAEHELNLLKRHVENHRQLLIEAWNDHFGDN